MSQAPQSAGAAVDSRPSQEEEMPQPTYWPMVLALGLAAVCFGLITVGIFFYAGLLTVVIAVVGWVRELMREPGPHGPAAGEREGR